MARPHKEGQRCDREEPEPEEQEARPHRAPCRRQRELLHKALGVAMAGAAGESRASRACGAVADERGGQDDDGKGHGEDVEGHERRDGEGGQRPVAHKSPAHPHQCLHDQRDDRCPEAEQQAVHQGNIAERHIEDREAQDCEEAGQHEQRPRNHAAQDAVHPPADVGGELLCLGARQQHAVVEGVEETALVDPAMLIHQFAMHQRDLPGRPPERQDADAGPDTDRLLQRGAEKGGVCHAAGPCQNPALAVTPRPPGARAFGLLRVGFVRREGHLARRGVRERQSVQHVGRGVAHGQHHQPQVAFAFGEAIVAGFVGQPGGAGHEGK